MEETVGTLQLECGIEAELLSAWIVESLESREVGESRWVVELADGPCVVTLTVGDPRKVRELRIPRTFLCVTGAQEALTAFKRLFMLRFASAGG
jgi:hypothetical protein